MNTLSHCLHLPLLDKELTERAARWQTYATRVAYGTLFFGAFLWMTRRFIGQMSLGQLGTGGEVVGPLLLLQVIGIHLFLPALMCGTVAREHESGSLPLLLVTPMSPGRIILQKYLAGLVPMFTFLLLGTPLFAIGYALGGVNAPLIAISTVVLVLAVCEVGAFTLLCSVCCRTTVSAFVATYVGGFLLALGGAWLAEGVGRTWATFGDVPWLFRSGNFGVVIPMAINAQFDAAPDSFRVMAKSGWLAQFAQWCAPSAALTLVSLVLARFGLQRRAFRPPRTRRPMRTWAVARVLRAMNARLGGVIFGRSSALPEDEPVAWREGRRFGLHHGTGALRVGAWITALAFAAVVVLEMAGLYAFPYENVDWFAHVGLVLAGLAALAMMPYAASAFAAERAGQTLAVLLTTPLGAREIVAQKGQFLMRVQCAFIPAMVALFLGQAGLYTWHHGGALTDDSTPVWLLTAIPALVVYPQVLAWGGLWIGLFCRTARTALLISLGLLAVFLFFPDWVIGSLYWFIDSRPGAHWSDTPLGDLLVHVVSPRQFQTTRIGRFLYVELRDSWPVALLAHYGLYGVIALAFRWLCLSRADRYLRRHA